jgi:hypothetical protein
MLASPFKKVEFPGCAHLIILQHPKYSYYEITMVSRHTLLPLLTPLEHYHHITISSLELLFILPTMMF